MKRWILLALTALALGAVGCSDDDNGPTGPNPPANTATSTWDEAGQFWRSTVDASSYTDYIFFSFTDRDTVASSASNPAEDWDIAFRREVIKTNGGATTTNSGDVKAVDLGAVAFSAVTLNDTTGKTWVSDQIEYFFDDWYTYSGPPLHQFVPNGNVYSMVDAGGHNYVKFRIDSLSGAGAPPNMGTVWLTYYYQPTADNTSLPGPTTSISIPVGAGTSYFDFSSGQIVAPATPGNSLDWDLGFGSYNVFMNSGPNGTGQAKGFYAYTELTDPTDIDAFTAQPAAPLFPDIPSSALTNWYNYTGPPLHQLLSNDHVYLVQSGNEVYAMQIESYYANIGGTPSSGHYTFIWREL